MPNPNSDDEELELDKSEEEIWDWLSQTMNPSPELPDWKVTLKNNQIAQVNDGTNTHTL